MHYCPLEAHPADGTVIAREFWFFDLTDQNGRVARRGFRSSPELPTFIRGGGIVAGMDNENDQVP